MLTSISSLCRIWDEERTYETPADVFTEANIFTYCGSKYCIKPTELGCEKQDLSAVESCIRITFGFSLFCLKLSVKMLLTEN